MECRTRARVAPAQARDDSGGPLYDVVSGKGPAWEYQVYQYLCIGLDWQFGYYEFFYEAKYEYVILTNSHEKFINDPETYPKKSAFYSDFYDDYEMVVEYTCEKGRYGASTIEYSKVKNRILIFKRR